MNVYFTVDTESSMSGSWHLPGRAPVPASRHVFCRTPDGEYGIPLQVRLLKRFGFRGTFFVETLATRCLGDADTASIFDYLLGEGQDVQLHIHPNFYFYSEWLAARAQGRDYAVPSPNDLIGHFDESRQMDLLGEAADLFARFAGYRPAAFRAGCFAGSRSMLRCLARLGIQVDSSFNPCYPALSFPDGPLPTNYTHRVEGVLEIPVTVARTRLPEGHEGYKFADCTSLSFAEIREMLDQAAAGGLQHFVVVFHSFSAVKPRDESYSAIRPNRVVIRRMEKMFAYLAAHPDRFSVQAMGSATTVEAAPSEPPAFVGTLGLARSAVRKAVQVLNRPYWV